MKRTVVLATVVSTLLAGVVSASAAPRPKAKPKPKPVSTTFFLHGTQSIGEVQSLAEGYGKMDTTAPTGSSARTIGITNYGAGPNTKCAGNSLFPVWTGDISGTPTGDATVELFLQNAGAGSFEVRLFADVFEQACNDAYVEPIGSATFAIASGSQTAKVVLKGINKKAKPFSGLMLQVSPVTGINAPYVSRISYDATNANSRITFSCLPKVGKKTC